eukprot:179314_1
MTNLRTQSKNIIIGSVSILLSQLCLLTKSSIVKSSQIAITEVLFVRFVMQFVCSTIWWISLKTLKTTTTDVTNKKWYGDQPYIANVWIRGSLYFIQVAAYYYSVERLPIGDLECVFQLSPLLTVFIAVVFLKEQLPQMFIFLPTVIFTIVGILILYQPTVLLNFLPNNNGDTLDPVGLISISIAIIAWSIANILTRIAKKAHFLQIEMACSFQSVFIWTPLLLLISHIWFVNDDYIGASINDWNYDWKSIILMMLVGFIGFAGLIFIII